MASAITRQACIKCPKSLGITTCGGCQQWFCAKHFVEHRQELATQMDDIGQEHDILQRDLIQDNVKHPLLSRIDEWERKSIEKINGAAEEARNDLEKYLIRTKDQLKTSFNQITNNLQVSRETDDYTEIELEKWIKQLKEFRLMLEKPITIEILDDDDDQTQPIIRLIQSEENNTSDSTDYPDRLIVDDIDNSDNSVVSLSQEKMNELKLFRGDVVFLKRNKNRKTVAILLADDRCPNDRLRVNRVIQNNIQARSGDVVLIQQCVDIKYGKLIYVRPTAITVQETEQNLLRVYLQPYFHESYRPVYKGDKFTVRAGMHVIEFEVIETEPNPYCIVAPDTIIICKGEVYINR